MVSLLPMSTAEILNELPKLTPEERRQIAQLLIELEEDRMDVKAALQALAESDERIPYEHVRRELGLAS